jgi:tripartite-type tricarboxylate transporter receptor subunit TctC
MNNEAIDPVTTGPRPQGASRAIPASLARAEPRGGRRSWALKLAVWVLGVAGGLALAPVSVQAQPAWPVRPVQVVVPFPAGGPPDTLARTLAEFLTRELGQPSVVSNRAGADTIIGADAVAKAPRDGYMLLILGDSGVINSASGRKLPYDLKNDLIPVSMVLSGPQVVMVSADSRFKTLNDMVSFARAHPGKVTFASAGAATSIRISTEIFNAAAGIDALHVPYKGVAAALNDIIGGQVDFIITGMSAAVTSIRGGKMRGLAINARKRSDQLPDLPTAVEQGIDVDTSGWYGLFMTAGSPAHAVERVHAAMVRASADETVRATMNKLGGEPRVMTRQEFAGFIDAELTRITALMKRLNITVD